MCLLHMSSIFKKSVLKRLDRTVVGTSVPLLSSVRFIYLVNKYILYFCCLAHTNSVYFSPKCRVFHGVNFLVHKIFTFYIKLVLKI
jgi:hypothetical protein